MLFAWYFFWSFARFGVDWLQKQIVYAYADHVGLTPLPPVPCFLPGHQGSFWSSSQCSHGNSSQELKLMPCSLKRSRDLMFSDIWEASQRKILQLSGIIVKYISDIWYWSPCNKILVYILLRLFCFSEPSNVHGRFLKTLEALLPRQRLRGSNETHVFLGHWIIVCGWLLLIF